MEDKYNDNELLYLMREGTYEAEEILYNKYIFLINKRISTFKIQKRYREDFFQEGLMCLNVAINFYNDIYNKSFNKFFDLILQRRFMALLKKDQEYFYGVILVEDYDLLNNLAEKESLFYEEENNAKIQEFKQEMQNKDMEFRSKILELVEMGLKPSQIALVLDCKVKKVYNEIYASKKSN